MIARRLQNELQDQLDQFPAVALLGPRQVGKTTLALELAKSRSSIYLDLESDSDRNKLTEPELYLSSHQDKLVILDEVHRLPGLFANLRGLIDSGRRNGRKAGQFLLLGSASLDLIQQTGESLAGRISYLELSPFDISETDDAKGRPVQVQVRGRDERMDVELNFRVGEIVSNPLGLGGSADGASLQQMQGTWTVKGTVAGRAVDFTAKGAAETFR